MAAASSTKKQYVVLSDAVVIEHRAAAEFGKVGHIARAVRGQIITLDHDVMNNDKIEHLLRLKGIAPYVEGQAYSATTAKVAVDAAGAEPDTVVAPVVAEQPLADPVAADAEDEGDSEQE